MTNERMPAHHCPSGGDKMKPALLVIDIQNKWLDTDPGLKECLEKRVGTINEAISFFRENLMPVIKIYHVDKDEGPMPGTPEFDFPSSIAIKANDIMVIKNYPDSFNKTGLMQVLRENGIDTVVLAGLSATCCVMATYVGAENNDLCPYLLMGGVAAGSEDKIKFAEEIMKTIRLNEIEGNP
ncbi:MAG TPA: cysteine hydrolase [Methanomassiliicoccales archaeon]|nr:cysteine hydrolase [Methanomassiliicoccales archaeon]